MVGHRVVLSGGRPISVGVKRFQTDEYVTPVVVEGSLAVYGQKEVVVKQVGYRWLWAEVDKSKLLVVIVCR